MDSGDQPHFPTKDAEIRYWKDFVERMMNEKDSLQTEFEEYALSSQQLERELEATIEQNEKTMKDMRHNYNREQNEKESLKLKLEQALHENEQLLEDVAYLKDEKMQLQKTVRLLEQKNDDLERNERTVAASVTAIEQSLNSAFERIAILESEVDEKESLKEKLQRLVDETRDLKQELNVKERCPDNERIINGYMPTTPTHNGNNTTNPVASSTTTATTTTTTNGVIDSNRLKVECETQTTPVKRDGSNVARSSLLDRPLTPSSRVLALHVIVDVMRKIGQLETQLMHCRPDYRSNGGDRLRRRLPSRGRTSPSLHSTNT